MAATGMQINSTAIPNPMDERGSYHFEPPAVIGKNGQGLAVTAGASKLTWQWPTLSKADFTWWTTTLLSGAASAEYTQCKFFDHTLTLTTYTHCIVNRPTYERIAGGAYVNVTIEIEGIR